MTVFAPYGRFVPAATSTRFRQMAQGPATRLRSTAGSVDGSEAGDDAASKSRAP